MIEEGVTFPPEGFPAPYMTVSGIPVFYALTGDIVPLRTIFGIPVIFTVLGDGFDAFPYHTTNSISILASLIFAINESIKSDSGVVNSILR